MRGLWWVAVAMAAVPMEPTPDCDAEHPELCPSDLVDWDSFSWIPAGSVDTVRPEELELGSGISLDRAFRLSAGLWEAPVAVLDSGIEWQSQRIARKIYLNVGELPVPEDSNGADFGDHDSDDNGLVNIVDYSQDPRVDHGAGVGGNGQLDASDLIAAFSDGVDDDGNGYVDDIAGWDFFEGDNNPYALHTNGYANHGTGVMEDVAEEGGDGSNIGACPNCAILPVRVGDSFISDADRVAQALVYATDRGVVAVAMAVGALSDSEGVNQAVQYADDHGVVMVGAAGDENAYHRNFPASHAPILFVHSIRGDNAQENEGTYSYLSFFNCNNFGSRLELVATSSACATGATARIAGAAGLLSSAGTQAGTPLATDEIRALLRGTADDIWLSEADRAHANTYPSAQGWDPFFGYGRVNVGRAVESIFAEELPPAVRFEAPEWFSFADGTVDVAIRVSGRSEIASWRIDMGRGVEPTEWEELAIGSGDASGVVTTIDTSSLQTFSFDELIYQGVVERLARAHTPTVTLRLTAEDEAGRVSEERRAFYVHRDPDALSGFPLRLDGSMSVAPALADLDGDGDYEVIAATGSGTVHAFQADGSELSGWPVSTDVLANLATGAPAFASGEVDPFHETILAAPAIGDITGDGEPEVVVASYAGGIYAWGADGALVDGFPVRSLGLGQERRVADSSWDVGFLAPPALGNVDGSGGAEIVLVGQDQRLYIINGDGSFRGGAPVDICSPCDGTGQRAISPPSLGDIDGDGDLDATFGTNEVPNGAAGRLYAYDLMSGTILPGFPIGRAGLLEQALLPVIGEGHPGATALADLDGDGRLEISSNAVLGASGLVAWDGSDGLALPYLRADFGVDSSLYTENSLMSVANHPAFGDLDGDGVPDVAAGGTGPFWLVGLFRTEFQEYNHGVTAWSGADGAILPGFPRPVDDVSFLVSPAIADISGDDRPELIYTSAGGMAYAWDSDGNLAPGWPKFLGGWALGGISVGDIDGDGWAEAVAATRDGWLFAWKTQGRADQVPQWPMSRHDSANTGNYHTPIPLQAGPVPVVDEEGCCKSKGDSAWLVFLPALLWRRRRLTR